jgi:hypothetical protein
MDSEGEVSAATHRSCHFSAHDDPDQHCGYGKDKKNVDETACSVRSGQSQNPQNRQDDGNGVKHDLLSFRIPVWKLAD